MLAFSRVKDPQRFGVPEFNADGTLRRILEKPCDPPSDFAVTGIYLYNQDYFEAFRSIAPSARGEYEISDINTWYIQNGKRVGYEEITGWWKDTGTPDALLEGNALVMGSLDRSVFAVEGEVEEGAQIQGDVKVGRGSRIAADCLVRGPVTIGEDCVIEGSYVGPYTSIGDRVRLTNAEVEHSVVFAGATIDTAERVCDSLIGLNATIVDARRAHPKTAHRLIVGDNSFVEL
jgi:glucose-1-phosphate thymidylyltransferase